MRKITWVAGIALVLWVGALVALPGPHRALVPWAFGLQHAGPGLWTDYPPRDAAVRNDLEQARARVAEFWGRDITPAITIVCHSKLCADVFALGVLGKTYGSVLVLLGPGGVNPTIMAHELSHVALHERLGLSDLWQLRYPIWFDEGLASHLSEDTRLAPPDNLQEALWITQAQTFRSWGRMVNADTWHDAYSAAARLVAEIETQIGRDGLRDMVAAIENGSDFSTEMATRAPSLLDAFTPEGP